MGIFYKIKKLFACNVERRAKLCPIFILSPPRSGSTLLFETMFNFRELYHLTYESDFVWWHLFPYARSNEPSDCVNESDYCEDSFEQYLSLYINGINNSTMSLDKQIKIKNVIEEGQVLRVLDKTIANCFHLKYLAKAFPEAKYIFLFRDPRDNISSMIEGWPYVDRFGKSQLTPYLKRHKDATISHWTYPAPPGWLNIVNKPLEEICAWSWQQHIKAMLDFIPTLNINDYISIKYEDIVNSPIEVYETISRKFDLVMNDNIYNAFENPKLSYTTISAPKSEKWKEKNYDQILSIVPIIRSMSLKIGYSL